MKKILGLTIVAVLLIGLTGIGTSAYFADTVSATGRRRDTGTLNQ